MSADSPNNFKVVAIGSSAGGYEAIKKFFKHLSDNPGMAFIIIQHITQDHKELSKQLISTLTSMPVVDAKEGAPIEINKVYITPINKILSLKGDRFSLNEKVKYVAISHPIDILFHAMGSELKERAIAIVMSGKGTDGSRGIRTITEAGGTVLVQSPDTAQYTNMPGMAISSGYADLVLTPEEMPAKLMELAQDTKKKENPKEEINISSEVTDIHNIIELLSNFSMVNFNHYKINTLIRRIEKRMAVTGQKSADAYYHYLKVNQAELTTLYKNSLIGVTSFFRDPEAWKAFENIILPDICKHKDHYEQLRIWVPACSTGEEVYTLAILLEDYIQRNKIRLDFKIFASDLDESALEFASLGRYTTEAVKDVSPELVEKYFENDDAFFAISGSIRKRIIFVKHNILRDPPFIHLDIISCRNLFIYLKSEVQRKIAQVFHYALRPFGYLMLGANEFLDENNPHFDKTEVKHKLYRSKDGERVRPHFFEADIAHPTGENRVVQHAQDKLTLAINGNTEYVGDLLLQEYAPSCVVMSLEGEVLYLHGDVGKYMKLPQNHMSTSVYKMIDRHLLPVIRNGIRKVINGDKSILFKDVPLSEEDKELFTNINFKTLVDEVTDQRFVLIEFGNIVRDTTKAVQVGELRTEDFSREYINDLETELKLIKRELQYTGQELEASREELQASNEEMLSSNEELQSTNEELQSSNEELYSVNSELKRKVDELTVLNNDINNLFLSTDIGIIFLDEILRIRKFTPSVNMQFNIREVDINRPILELNQNFECKDFEKDIQDVLEKGQPAETEIKNKNGKYYIMRIIPYQTGQIDGSDTSGIIISFVDISDIKKANNQLKKLTRELQRSESNLQSLIDNTPDIIVQYNKELKIRFLSHSAGDLLKINAAQIIGKSNTEVGLFHDGESERLDEKLQKVIETGQPDDFYTDIQLEKSRLFTYMKLAPEINNGAEVQSVLAIARDITPLKQAEIRLQNKNEELEKINKYLDEFVYAIAHDLRAPVASLRNIVTLFHNADDQRKAELLRLLDKSVAQLDKTLNGLVDMIDSQADGNIKSEICSFQDIFSDIQNELADMLAEAEAELCVNFEGAAKINYIKSFLYSILRNLVSNAIKYRSENRKLKITITTQPVDHHYILLSVADNGIGINLEKYGHQLFKPFKRLNTQKEGKGIGLHIIKNMVERNGGKIEVESTPGKGTRFNVSLKEY